MRLLGQAACAAEHTLPTVSVSRDTRSGSARQPRRIERYYRSSKRTREANMQGRMSERSDAPMRGRGMRMATKRAIVSQTLNAHDAVHLDAEATNQLASYCAQ